MSIVIHVGSDEDLPDIPKDFPRCGGDWYPTEMQEIGKQNTPAIPNAAGALQRGVLACTPGIADIIAFTIVLFYM